MVKEKHHLESARSCVWLLKPQYGMPWTYGSIMVEPAGDRFTITTGGEDEDNSPEAVLEQEASANLLLSFQRLACQYQ